jgi:hypothetical protein
VTNDFGAGTSSAATVTIAAVAPARLVNMSVRAPLADGATIIPGFVTAGTGSRALLVRAVGPTLVEYDVNDALPDPAMTVYAGNTPLLANDDWGDATNAGEIADTTDQLGGFALEADSADAAALLDFGPGLFTTHVTGAGGSAGIMLFELYEGGGADLRLVNISARGDIGTGENIMIPGFTLVGTGARTLLIRAVGPSLEGQGVASGWLEDPELTIYQGTAPILTIDDWGEVPDVTTLVATSETLGAFALDDDSTDAAVLAVLMPGIYTALARGADGGTGNVLVEVYEVP